MNTKLTTNIICIPFPIVYIPSLNVKATNLWNVVVKKHSVFSWLVVAVSDNYACNERKKKSWYNQCCE
jgi:hypothetical protein